MSEFFTVSAFNACDFLLFAMAALLCLALIGLLLPAAGIVVPYLLGVTAIFQKKKK